jgi:hypothetical protein
MSAHPGHCPACRGSGYTDGPPITETVNGQPHEYTTVTPCTHDWWHDDPGPYYDDRTPRE